MPDADPSPALSQIGPDLAGGRPRGGHRRRRVQRPWTPCNAARKALDAAGIVPLVIAPAGGFLGAENDGGIPVQRTYLTARSTEFDAVIVAGSGAPAADAEPGLDAKAGEPGASLDPRVVLLLSEAFRHAKAIGAWGSGAGGVDAASIPEDAAGVVLGDGPEAVVPPSRTCWRRTGHGSGSRRSA